MQKTIFLGLLCLRISIYAQTNIVKNPGFEEHSDCPENIGEFDLVNDWSNPTLGTTDYFNECSNNEACSVPSNLYWSYQNAHGGKGYAGIITDTDEGEHREYLQGQLKCSMVQNAVYHVEFYVSLSNRSQIATSSFGIYFTGEEVDDSTYYSLPLIPQFQNPVSNIIMDTAAWVKIQGEYTATGNENFFVIGNFFNDSNSVVEPVPWAWGGGFGHYYIDDVDIHLKYPLPYQFIAPNVFTPNGDGANDEFYFTTDSISNLYTIIYNRWGENIYHFSGLNTTWNGNDLDGNPVPEGVYFYTTDLTLAGCNTERKSGNIHVFR